MGGGENEITIDASLDANGFESGTKRMEDAVKSLGKTIENVFNGIKSFIKNLDFKSLGDAFKNGDWEAFGKRIKEAMEKAAESIDAIEEKDADAEIGDPEGESKKWDETKKSIASVGDESKKVSKDMEGTAKKGGGFFSKAFSGVKKAFSGIAGIAGKAFGGIRSIFSGTERGAQSAMGGIKRLTGLLIGVGGAYQIISKAVNAFMAENEQLSANLSSAWTALGNVLGPIITQIINWITSAVSYFLEFLRLLGVTNKSASELSKKTKGAGSEMKKTLAGFDELNLLNGQGGGGGANGRLEDKEAPEWIKDIADFLKKGEWEKAGETLANKLNEMVASVDWAEIGRKIGYYLNGALTFAASFIKNFNWKALGGDIATLLNNIMYETDFTNLGIILASKITTVILLLGGFLENLDWAELAHSFNEFALGFLDSISEAIASVDWYKIGEGIKTFLEEIDWKGIAESVFDLLGVALGAAVSLLWGVIEDAVKSIRDYFSEYIQKYIGTTNGTDPGAEIITGIMDGIVHALANIGTWIYDHMFKPFIDGFKKAFQINSPSKVMEEQGGFIVDGLLGGLKDTWTDVTGWLSGLWDDFSDTFTGIVDDASSWGGDLVQNFSNGMSWVANQAGGLWDNIRSIASGIWEWLHFSEPEKGPLADFHTWAPDMMNTFADGIKENRGKVIGAVGGLAGDISDAMNGGDFSLGQINVSGIDGVMNGFADKIVGGFENLIDRLQAIADNVVFTMPAIAEGSIVPYGVSGGATGGGSGGGNADLEALVMQLMDLISDFRDSVENMQWVARFGNVQAVVQEISRIQKQNERARG